MGIPPALIDPAIALQSPRRVTENFCDAGRTVAAMAGERTCVRRQVRM